MNEPRVLSFDLDDTLWAVEPVMVAAGLTSTKFKMSNGPVSIAVSRSGKTTVKFSTPEGITDHPYRTDRLTYSYSSEFDRFYKNLYPGFKPQYSHEYNPQFTDR